MHWGITLLLILATAAGGCASKSSKNGAMATSAVSNDSSPAWPFWPTRMRLHPLSRVGVDAESGQAVIEVRLELFDDTGDTVKGVGQVRIDLHQLPVPAGSASMPPLATWNPGQLLIV